MENKIFTTLNEYKQTFSPRIKNYKEQYEDFDELLFINNEIEFYETCYNSSNFELKTEMVKKGKQKYIFDCYGIVDINNKKINEDVFPLLIDDRHKDEFDKIGSYYYSFSVNYELSLKLKQSFSKIIVFLNESKKAIEQTETIEHQKEAIQVESFKLTWGGTELELSELIKALIESKKISPELTQKEIFKRFKNFFNLKDFNENDKLKEIRNRTNTQTPLLNTLESSLNNWIKSKD